MATYISNAHVCNIQFIIDKELKAYWVTSSKLLHTRIKKHKVAFIASIYRCIHQDRNCHRK